MKVATDLDISNFVLQVVEWIATIKVQLTTEKIKALIQKQ